MPRDQGISWSLQKYYSRESGLPKSAQSFCPLARTCQHVSPRWIWAPSILRSLWSPNTKSLDVTPFQLDRRRINPSLLGSTVSEFNTGYASCLPQMDSARCCHGGSRVSARNLEPPPPTLQIHHLSYPSTHPLSLWDHIWTNWVVKWY